ncbi:MAG: hypothetical protein QN185_05390 [Armatimonadota bacterium]|nr:hypothetical protein [Armatimonadota bacterium]
MTDLADLLRLLEERPEWKNALRTVLLGEEFLQLPELVRRLAVGQERIQQELAALAAEVRGLAEAQRRTEERVGRLEQALAELAEAQRRTEERVGRLEQALAELAEAQRRTEERVGRLEQALAELAEAQRRTEERVGRLEQALAELAEAQRRTQQQLSGVVGALRVVEARLGRLEDALGLTVEEHAEDILLMVLEDKGLRVLEGPHPIPVDGEGQVDLAAVCEDASGNRLTVVVESKARLSVSALRRWADRVGSSAFRDKLRQAGLPGPFLAYAFGIRVDRAVEQAARERGLGLLSDRGELVAPAGPLD